MKTVQLKVKTDPKWVRAILANFDEFLGDHADCERKASAMAMGFVAKCPDRVKIIPELIALALEELDHFRQVYELMEKRGLKLTTHATEDLYVNSLLKLCRSTKEERFLDRLLVASIIEARGAERFRLVCEALGDSELKAFYRMLYSAEARHGNAFANMALHYFDEATIDARLEELIQEEARIIRSLKWRASLH